MSANPAAEQAVLGSLMLETSRAAEVNLLAEDFTASHHREIYRAIRSCVERRIRADAVTVSEFLERHATMEFQWLVYCAELVRETPSAANVKAYAEIVKQRADAVRAKRSAMSLVQNIDNEPELLDSTIRELMQLTRTQRDHECRVGDTLGSIIDYIDFRQNNRGVIPGLRTGIEKLDRAILGLNKGDLVVIAGRPGMGKTAILGGIHLANRKVPTGCMSAEMPRDQLVMRMVSSISGVPLRNIRLGELDDEHWPRMNTAFNMIRDMPLHINDRSAPDIEEIVRQARRWKYEHDIQLLSLDYLQRIPTPRGVKQRNEGVEYITRTLKELARDLEIPVVALSAVGREVEKREDKRPLMSDLRDSGAIEAEADNIITLYREEVYSDDQRYAGLAELGVIKQRNGEICRVVATYTGATVTFGDFRGDGGDDGSGGVPGGDGAAQRSMELGHGADDRPADSRATGRRPRKSLQEIHQAKGR
jgi:replicative DNA helicase